MTRRLGSGDLREVTGITPKTLKRWCDGRVVVPVAGGGGQGNHLRFTVMQTVGIAVALAVRNSPQSCTTKYCREIAQAFTTMEEGELLRRIEIGHTHLAMIYFGDAVMDGPNHPHWIDVRAVYEEVTEKIEQIVERYRGFVGGRGKGHGRGRGLAPIGNTQS